MKYTLMHKEIPVISARDSCSASHAGTAYADHGGVLQTRDAAHIAHVLLAFERTAADACTARFRLMAVETPCFDIFCSKRFKRLGMKHFAAEECKLDRLFIAHIVDKNSIFDYAGVSRVDTVNVCPEFHLFYTERSADDRRGEVGTVATEKSRHRFTPCTAGP